MIHQNLNMIWGYTWIILRFKTLYMVPHGSQVRIRIPSVNVDDSWISEAVVSNCTSSTVRGGCQLPAATVRAEPAALFIAFLDWFLGARFRFWPASSSAKSAAASGSSESAAASGASPMLSRRRRRRAHECECHGLLYSSGAAHEMITICVRRRHARNVAYSSMPNHTNR